MDIMVIDINDLVAQYLNEHPRGILRVKSTDDARSRDPEMDNLILPDATPLYNWIGRIEYDINRLYLVPTPFKTWCLKRGHHGATVDDLMLAHMGLTKTKIRLGKGTKMKLPLQHVWVVEWDDSNDAVDGY